MVFALSYRPFNTGGFAEDKSVILELMAGRAEPDTFEMFQDSFGKRSGMTRDDLGMLTNPLFGMCGREFSKLTSLPTKRNSSEIEPTVFLEPKLRGTSGILECHETCMSVCHFHGGSTCVDPDIARSEHWMSWCAYKADERVDMRTQFSKLKENLGGGLKLAYHLMSKRLLQMTHIIAMSTRPYWSWYTKSVKNVKSPQDHLKSFARLASSWQQETLAGNSRGSNIKVS